MVRIEPWLAILAAAALTAAPAFADGGPNLTDAPRAAQLELAPTPSGQALMLGTQTAALIGAGVVSYLVGSSWAIADFNSHGRPDPQILAASIALSLALNLAITWLLIPELSRLSDDERAEVDVHAIRREVWKTTRWVALAGAIFVGLFAFGAAQEHREFGKGQALMMLGLVGAGASVLTFDISALFASKQALATHRHPAEAE